MKSNKIAVFLISFALLSVKSLGCTLSAGQEKLFQEIQRSVNLFFAIAFLLFVGTAAIWFIKRKREALIPIIISGLSISVYFMGSNIYIGDCGGSAAEGAKRAAIIAFVCFAAQFITRLLFRKKSRAELS
jgi:hypothetical protein